MPPPPPGIAERRFAAADGVRLHAWLAPPPDATAPLLVWSHGNGGNVGGREDALLALAALAGNQFDSASRVSAIGVPILIAHGDQDETVPYALGERLFARAREPKQLVRVPGRQQNDVFDSPALLDAIAAFARESVAATSVRR